MSEPQRIIYNAEYERLRKKYDPEKFVYLQYLAMITRARIITICSLEIATDLDILEYEKPQYDNCAPDDLILTSYARVYSREQYLNLCTVLGVRSYEPARQEVKPQTLPPTSRANKVAQSTAFADFLQWAYLITQSLLNHHYPVFLYFDVND